MTPQASQVISLEVDEDRSGDDRAAGAASNRAAKGKALSLFLSEREPKPAAIPPSFFGVHG